MIEENITQEQAIKLLNTPVDWNKIDSKLDSIREHGLTFLRNALNTPLHI
jgi:hypothetical protein